MTIYSSSSTTMGGRADIWPTHLHGHCHNSTMGKYIYAQFEAMYVGIYEQGAATTVADDE